MLKRSQISTAKWHWYSAGQGLRLPAVCLVARKVRSNLGPDVDELGPKPSTTTQNKARRTNEIDFLQLPWAQEVRGSNPRAPTIQLNDLRGFPLKKQDFLA